ncbi:MAG: aminotransferase class V-fold PLP-dependent enzyme [Sphingomonadaceae bacterium]|nr:aminotransferase class V-fold PLP-dependent enzyme [Sphingomonadaceae bacterium]
MATDANAQQVDGGTMTAGARVYLDFAATAPLDPAAAAAMAAWSGRAANPSSVHAEGRAARAALEAARAEIATALGWRGEVILTSGGTEAIRLGVEGARRVLVSAVEHAAVLGAVPRAGVIPVDAGGRVRLNALAAMLAEGGPALVAVQQGNNETGVVQPLAQVASLVRAQGGLLLADCVQSAGRMALPDADFIAVSAHKLGGPAGCGALLVRDLGLLSPRIGGGQERGYRPGTENWLGAIAWASAMRARAADAGWSERAAALRDRAEAAMVAAGGRVIGGEGERLPHISCVALPGVDAQLQLMALDLEGFAVSAGAACSSGRVRASHVLTAMGISERAAGEAIRVSVGWTTAADGIDRFAAAYARMAGRLAARSAA